MQAPVPRHILPVLVLAQFAGTSLWFAINAVMPDLQRELGWSAAAAGTLTSALQLGFIVGALVFAFLSIADRFSTRRVFLLCSLAGALCTVGAWAMVRDYSALLAWRFATGFFLAGIYPVGMKMAAQWYTRGLGSALGLLIGALVLGSASAHALRALGDALPWPTLMLGVAALAAAGGLLLFFGTTDALGTEARVTTLQWRALATVATDARVRSSVLGYFGHMWELYTLWVLVPVILATRLHGAALSWTAFAVIGSGAIGCAVGGWVAQRWGSAHVAAVQLAASGLCGLAAPWLLGASAPVFFGWLLLWGITVAGDSPQLSTLTARNAPARAVGSVLTLTNSLGFALSIGSILLFLQLAETLPLATLLPWLALGPALGVWALWPLLREEQPAALPRTHRRLPWPLRALAALGTWLLALVLVFEEWGWGPLQALLARVGRWPGLRWVEGRVCQLPPWAALLLFAVPTALLLPIKLMALWAVGRGQVALGVAVIVLAKVVGTAVVARLFTLTQPALLQLRWFAWGHAHWLRLKTRLLLRVHTSWLWRVARVWRRGVRRRWQAWRTH